MAIAAAVQPSKHYGANSAVPALFNGMFPGWFAGFAFAAIAIGALVPASVMSIAAANLFSRNVFRDLFKRDATPRQEATASRLMSLLVKVGALVFILLAPATQVINFQLAGGVWILQTLPAVFLALYVSWVNRWAVAAGWLAGIGWGRTMLVQEHFDSPTHVLGFLPGTSGNLYIALIALVLNLIVAVGGSLVLNAVGLRTGTRLSREDYLPRAAAPRTDTFALEPDASEPLVRDTVEPVPDRDEVGRVRDR